MLFRHTLLKTSLPGRTIMETKTAICTAESTEGGKQLEVIFSIFDDVLTAELFGELDHHQATGVREAIDREINEYDTKNLILDFSKVRYMDSSGIGMVLGRYRKLDEKGGSVVISGCSAVVQNILNMAGIFSLMQFRNTKEEAVSYFLGKEVF